MSIPSDLDVVNLDLRTDGSGQLVRKLVEIMGACRFIPKSGWNDFHKYHYATEADVSKSVAPLMVERNLLMIPSVLQQDVIKIDKEKRGQVTQEVLWTGLMAFTVIDGDTGERLSFRMSGQGQDAGDKAAFKGQTGAQKYAMLKLFQIETGLDPENDNGRQQDPTGNGSPGRQNGPGPSQRPNTPTSGVGRSTGQPGASQAQSRPPASQDGQTGSGRMPTSPGYKKAVEMAESIGWTPKDMMRAVNEMLQKRGSDPVEKWLDLDASTRNSFYDKMKARAEKGSGSGAGRQEERHSPPDAEQITDMMDLISLDYGDFLRWVNRMREMAGVEKIKSWDNLDTSWKWIVYNKLQERVSKELGRGI